MSEHETKVDIQKKPLLRAETIAAVGGITAALISGMVALTTSGMESAIKAEISAERARTDQVIAEKQTATAKLIENLKSRTAQQIAASQNETARLVERLKSETSREIVTKQNETARLVERMKTETSVEISEKQNETAKELESLRQATAQNIASAENAVQRAQMFAKFMESLGDSKKSSIAVLALWQLANTPEHQRIVVAAAMTIKSTPVIDTLIQLGAQVEPFVKDALNANDPETRKLAKQVLKGISAVDVARINLDDIKSSDRPNPFDEIVKNLIKRIKSKPEARELVIAEAAKPSKHQNLFRYALYAAGDQSYLDAMLTDVNSMTGAGLRDFLDIMNRGGMQAVNSNDWEKVVTPPLTYIETVSLDKRDDFLEAGVFELFDSYWLKEDFLSSVLWRRISKQAIASVTTKSRYTYARYYAFNLLTKIAPRKAVDAISVTLSEEESDLTVVQNFQSALEQGNLGRNSLRSQFPSLAIPKTSDSPGIWAAWHNSNPLTE